MIESYSCLNGYYDGNKPPYHIGYLEGIQGIQLKGSHTSEFMKGYIKGVQGYFSNRGLIEDYSRLPISSILQKDYTQEYKDGHAEMVSGYSGTKKCGIDLGKLPSYTNDNYRDFYLGIDLEALPHRTLLRIRGLDTSAIIVAIISLISAAFVVILTYIFNVKQNRELTEQNRYLKVLKSRLETQKDQKAAKTDYEYEARKNLYVQFEPLLFQLHELSHSSHCWSFTPRRMFVIRSCLQLALNLVCYVPSVIHIFISELVSVHISF